MKRRPTRGAAVGGAMERREVARVLEVGPAPYASERKRGRRWRGGVGEEDERERPRGGERATMSREAREA